MNSVKLKLYICAVLSMLCVPAFAQDMSVPTSSFSGHVIFRQHNNERNTSVFRQFLALIPQYLIQSSYFEKSPPAAYYNILPRETVLNTETLHAAVVPPFSRFEFKSVPAGKYWLCKFNNADEIDINAPEMTEEFIVSGCQFTEIFGSNDTERNYYADEFGFWFDDFPEELPEAPEPALQPATTGDSSCTPD